DLLGGVGPAEGQGAGAVGVEARLAYRVAGGIQRLDAEVELVAVAGIGPAEIDLVGVRADRHRGDRAESEAVARQQDGVAAQHVAGLELFQMELRASRPAVARSLRLGAATGKGGFPIA